MFNKQLKLQAKELKETNESLEKEKTKLKEEVADLKLKKKIEDEDIKHMVKMEREKLAIEQQKKELELEKVSREEISKVRDEYRDKTEAQLEKRVEEMKSMHGDILARLPNINVKLNGKVDS